ncbi:voltage-gated potassium channel [Aureococcus anophagefferens]|nr:voltage-gated potassium channel [Aureococcus anophagefferens]
MAAPGSTGGAASTSGGGAAPESPAASELVGVRLVPEAATAPAAYPSARPVPPPGDSAARRNWKKVRAMVKRPSGADDDDGEEDKEDLEVADILELEAQLGKELRSSAPSFIWPDPPRDKPLLHKLRDGDHFPVLHPDGLFRIKWDALQVVSLCYVSVIVPMRLGFSWPAVGLWFVLDTLVDIYFLIDVAFGFLTAIYSSDDEDMDNTFGGAKVIVCKKRIAARYLRGWFTIDILACAPIDFSSRVVAKSLTCSFHVTNPCTHRLNAKPSSSAFRLVKILRVFRVLKLFRLFRLKRLITKYQDELIYWMPFISATKLLFALLWASHWMGCCYALVFPFDRDAGILARYVDCVYWAMQTITTVGYGDMTSTRTSARLVATGGMAVGGLIFGWLIQYVLNVLDPDTFERKQQARVERVMAYLRANSLPNNLSQRVVRHVRQQNSRQTEDRSVLVELPRQLRSDICLHLYEGFISQVPLLQGTNHHFIADVCTKVVPLTIPLSELVYGSGDIAEEGAYVVVTGEVALLGPKPARKPRIARGLSYRESVTQRRTVRERAQGSRHIVTLGPGGVFGESSALGCTRRCEEAIARKTCELLTITGPSLRGALDMVPALRWKILKHSVGHAIACTYDHRTIAQILSELHLPELLMEEEDGPAQLAASALRVLRPRVPRVRPDWHEILLNMREVWEHRVCGIHEETDPAIASGGKDPISELRAEMRTMAETIEKQNKLLDARLEAILAMGALAQQRAAAKAADGRPS